VDEYAPGHHYALMEFSRRNTGGHEGVEIVVNEPREEVIPVDPSGIVRKSQYTHKILHLSQKVPSFLRMLAPTGSLVVHQMTWNCYPLLFTAYKNDYMKDSFVMVIETRFEADAGQTENIFNLSAAELSKRVVDVVDFVNDPCDPRDYKASEDPSTFVSQKTGRGPLGAGWVNEQSPVMCCYSLYRLSCKWWGLQSKMESLIIRSVRRILYNMARLAWCSVDSWLGMSMEEIRAMEAQTKQYLDDIRNSGSVKGMAEK
jgi:hypothetical protein